MRDEIWTLGHHKYGRHLYFLPPCIFHVFRKFVHIISCWTRIVHERKWLAKSRRYGSWHFKISDRTKAFFLWCPRFAIGKIVVIIHSLSIRTFAAHIHKATELTAISPSARTDKKKTHINKYIYLFVGCWWWPERLNRVPQNINYSHDEILTVSGRLGPAPFDRRVFVRFSLCFFLFFLSNVKRPRIGLLWVG